MEDVIPPKAVNTCFNSLSINSVKGIKTYSAGGQGIDAKIPNAYHE